MDHPRSDNRGGVAGVIFTDNLDALRYEFSNSDLCNKLLSFKLNDLVKCCNNTLRSALDRHAPLMTKTVAKRPTVP